MENLVKLDIVFENCDSITINRDDIYNFFISDITESVSLVSNALIVYKKAGQCHLTLRWDKVKNLFVELEDTRTLEHRIKSKDITNYQLHLTDGTELVIYVPWEGGDYTNTKEIHEEIQQKNKELFTIIH